MHPGSPLRALATCAALLLLLGGCYDVTGDDDDAADDDDSSSGDDDDDATDDDDDDDATDDDDDDDATDDDDDDATPPEGLTCLPVSQELSNTWGSSTQVQLTAEVFDEHGNGVPAEDVWWSVVQGGGSVDATGLYTTPGDHGGQVLVQAQVQAENAYCEILIELEATDNVTGDPDVVSEAGSTTVVVDDGCASTFTYPLDGSAMPGSFAPPLIQWASGGNDAHVLTLESSYTTVTVFTFADSYQVTDAFWASLTTYDPGTSLTLSLTSGTWNGSSFVGNLCTASEALYMEVVDGNLDGTILYWEPPVFGQGLKLIDFGSTSNYDLTVGGAMGCVGCHGVNLANPNRLAFADQMSAVSVVDASDPLTPVVQGQMMSGAAAALNPAGDRMVRSAMLVFSGSELILDDVAAGGATLGDVPAQGAGQAFPNWSPDGQTLVYSACDAGGTEYGADNCSIRGLEVLPGDQWGTDWSIAQATAGESLYYPAISPDNDWVLYNRASGGVTTSYDNPAGELWITGIDGGGDLILLENATSTGHKNSWPKFAPATPGDYVWFAFSTSRPYGNLTDGTSQIWLAAMDMDLAEMGGDPSFAPVWLPGQNTGAGNYIPIWIPRYLP